LPTASELAGIYKSKPFFPTSGAEWYWTSDVYAKGTMFLSLYSLSCLRWKQGSGANGGSP